ncbi:hypothetical protein HK099_002611, partial [Clydaea vesicula]
KSFDSENGKGSNGSILGTVKIDLDDGCIYAINTPTKDLLNVVNVACDTILEKIVDNATIADTKENNIPLTTTTENIPLNCSKSSIGSTLEEFLQDTTSTNALSEIINPIDQITLRADTTLPITIDSKDIFDLELTLLSLCDAVTESEDHKIYRNPNCSSPIGYNVGIFWSYCQDFTTNFGVEIPDYFRDIAVQTYLNDGITGRVHSNIFRELNNNIETLNVSSQDLILQFYQIENVKRKFGLLLLNLVKNLSFELQLLVRTIANDAVSTTKNILKTFNYWEENLLRKFLKVVVKSIKTMFFQYFCNEDEIIFLDPLPGHRLYRNKFDCTGSAIIFKLKNNSVDPCLINIKTTSYKHLGNVMKIEVDNLVKNFVYGNDYNSDLCRTLCCFGLLCNLGDTRFSCSFIEHEGGFHYYFRLGTDLKFVYEPMEKHPSDVFVEVSRN